MGRDVGDADRLAEGVGTGAADTDDLTAGRNVHAARRGTGLAAGERDDAGVVGAARYEGDRPGGGGLDDHGRWWVSRKRGVSDGLLASRSADVSSPRHDVASILERAAIHQQRLPLDLPSS